MNRFFLFLILGIILSSVFQLSAAAEVNRPAGIIRLPENEHAIIVEKDTQTLLVYAKNSETFISEFKVPCSTGEVSGVKQEAGDRKTPEGVYFLKDEFEDKYLSPIYGQRAFPTDYPNLVDKRAGKNGSAIWLHGTNKKLVPMDSNGCVALENENILKLSEYVTLDSTPVIMVDTLKMVSNRIALDREKEILSMLGMWRQAFEKGSYHKYLSFYSQDYLPDISWWEEWLEVRKELEKKREQISFDISRTGIYQHDDLFVVLFDSHFSKGDKVVNLGKRKLFIKKLDGSYKIVGDVFQRIADQFSEVENVFAAAGKSIIGPVWQKDDIIAHVNEWMKAWSDKDMERYGAFYASSFYSDGMNKKRWVRRKTALAKQYDFIRVSGKDFKVTKNKNACEVVFFQDYESSGLSTQGTKRLKLINEGGLWKIYQESWKKK